MQVRIGTGILLIGIAVMTLQRLGRDESLLESRAVHAQELPPPELVPATSANQFAGTTKCGACHFAQFKDWRGSPHGQAFEVLPSKYRQDESCLKCHNDEHSRQLASSAATQAMTTGVTCESCHGPGGDHVRYGLSFIEQGREFTEESLQVMRSKIERTSMDRCVACHTAIAHKPHPEYDRDTAQTQSRQSGLTKPSSNSFFQVHR